MPPSIATAVPFADLIGHSFDEAAFLWRRWEHELASPTRNLDEVWSWTEDRLHGALDGVRVAGADLVDLAVKELLSEENDRVTVAAGLLASSQEPRAGNTLSDALHAAEGIRLAVILRALELLGTPHALRSAASVLSANGPFGAAALCRLKAFRRVAAGDELMVAFESGVPSFKATALRAALYVPTRRAEEIIAVALDDDNMSVRLAAAETGMCRGMRVARDMAFARPRRLDAATGPFLRIVGMLGEADDHEIVFAALRVPALQLHAIWALGHIGTARAAEACLAGMRHEKLARASGEAYCWITGADLARDSLARKETPVDAPAFEDDDLDANLVPPPEAQWPVPDLEAVTRHWGERQAAFSPNVRHIHGRPASTHTLMTMMESGPMLRRPDLAFELRARTQGKYDVEASAFSNSQRQMMAAGRAAASSHGER